MGKKYIIEVEDGKEGIIFCQTGIVTVGLHLDDESSLRPLGIQSAIPYTEPDTDACIDYLHKQGWLQDHDKQITESEYKRGLNDAWEAAGKIAHTLNGNLVDVFGTGFDFQVFTDFTAQEAIEKLRQYEKQKEEKDFGEVRDVLEETVKACNVTLDEIAEVLQKMMREE